MDQFGRQTLDSHNKYRAKHQAPSLTWNLNLAWEAQSWAERLANEDRLKHASTDDGENIYMSFGHEELSGDLVVDKWYEEIKNYSFRRPGFQSNTGHFTQVVWRDSKELGVGKAQGYEGKVFVVARYRPPGNNLRAFEENVCPATGGVSNKRSSGHRVNYNDRQTSTKLIEPSNRYSGTLDLYTEPRQSTQDSPKRYSDGWKPEYENRYYPAKRNSGPWDPIDNDKNFSVHRVPPPPKWDSGSWFDQQNESLVSTPTQQEKSNADKNYQNEQRETEDREMPSKRLQGRWQPVAKDFESKQDRTSINDTWKCWKPSRGKGNVSVSKQKWESLASNGETESAKGYRYGNSGGRTSNKTRDSIEKWEQQSTNQNPPNKPNQAPIEQWDSLTREKPFKAAERRARPVSYHGGNKDQIYAEQVQNVQTAAQNNQSSPFDEPRERKITTTFVDGPRQTVVSSVTITLKGNEGYRNMAYSNRSKSTEDLRRRPDSSYPRSSRGQVQEVYAAERATPTNTRPKPQEFLPPQRSYATRTPVKEEPIVMKSFKAASRPQYNDTPDGYSNTKPLTKFPSLDFFAQQALDAHNEYRSLHGAHNLMWSPEIATTAQAWAEKIARDQSLKHTTRERGSDGENFAILSGNFANAAKEATDLWFAEIKNYNFKRPGYHPKTGHFTQLVWKDSREFGMGRAQTSDGQNVYVVARYRPGGNVLRQYELNVFPSADGF